MIVSNGLNIYKKHIQGTGYINFSICFNVGLAYEPKNKKGITHLLEHMLFRGIGKYNYDELEKLFCRMGTEVYGKTGYDSLSLSFSYSLQAKSDTFKPNTMRAKRANIITGIFKGLLASLLAPLEALSLYYLFRATKEMVTRAVAHSQGNCLEKYLVVIPNCYADTKLKYCNKVVVKNNRHRNRCLFDYLKYI